MDNLWNVRPVWDFHGTSIYSRYKAGISILSKSSYIKPVFPFCLLWMSSSRPFQLTAVGSTHYGDNMSFAKDHLSVCLSVGSEVRRAGGTVRSNYCPSLDRLRRGDRIGVRCTADGCLRLVINGEDMGVAASGLPKVGRLRSAIGRPPPVCPR